MYTIRTGCVGQVMVEFGPTTSYGRNTAWYPVTSLNYTSVLVAGMRASTTYHMRSQVQCATGSGTTSTSPDITFTTGPLPSSLAFPQIVVSRPNPSLSSTENPGIESIDVAIRGTPAFFTDRDGNIIWYYYAGSSSFAFPFKLLPDGNMLLIVTDGATFSNLVEVDLAGDIVRELTTIELQHRMANIGGFDFIPFGFHHDFASLPNGHVIALVYCFKDFTDLPGYPGTIRVTGDALVDLDQNWNPVWGWNSFDHLDINRHLLGLPDWMHSNGLFSSPDDGNLFLSIRHQSWIIKIDYSNGAGTGNILWHLGYQGDFALTVNGVPSDDPSEWFSFQHFPRLLSQSGSLDNLAVWDNGDLRVLNAATGETCEDPRSGRTYPACYSRAIFFQLDQSSMVANLEWADPVLYYSTWGGSINRFPNENVEFESNAMALPPSPEDASIVEEVTYTPSPEIVWQMEVTPVNVPAYRAYRVPSLYNGVTWQY